MPEAPTPSPDASRPSEAHPNRWKDAVAHLKDTKEVLLAIAVIGGAIAFALNYFATTRALDCFKAESRTSNELVQTMLQVGNLTASWESTNYALRHLNTRNKNLALQLGSPEHDLVLRDIAKTEVQAENISAELKAARDRKFALEQTIKPCE